MLRPTLLLSLLITLSCFSPALGGHRVEYWSSWTATELQAEAIKLAKLERYSEAVPWFVRALRRDPSFAACWNNIAVTHMRVAEFGLARDAFIRCEVLEPGHVDCATNRRELDDFLLSNPRMRWTDKQVVDITGRSRYAIDTAHFHAAAASLTPGYQRDAPFWETRVGPTEEQLEGTVPWPGGSAAGSDRIDVSRYNNGRDDEEDGDATSPPIKPHSSLAADGSRVVLPVERMEHEVVRLPRIPILLLYHQNNSLYARGLKPFILTGIAEQPQWLAKTQSAFSLWGANNDLSFFTSSSFATAAQADYYPSNMRYVGVKPLIIPMKEALREMTGKSHNPDRYFTGDDGTFGKSGNGGGGGKIIQWNANSGEWRRLLRYLGPLPPLFHVDELWLEHPKCLGSSWAADGTYENPAGTTQQPTKHPEELRSEFFLQTHWRMLLIGTKGAGMFFHADILGAPSWQLQVTGRKSWVICDPADGQEANYYSAGDVDPFNPDYARFPLFRKARCYHDTVHTGEALFYPSTWWHATLNEETYSIAISGSVVDGNSFRTVQKELGIELAAMASTGRRIRAAGPEYRAAMEKGCFKVWSELWDPAAPNITGL